MRRRTPDARSWRHLVVRHPHRRLARLRRRAGAVALLGVVGPGLLAGLSDDDPAGITTYSILGADYGYRLLWVLALSTVALIVFHELAARMGVVTGKGLLRLVRERYGTRAVDAALAALLVANLGTICAEFAGIAAGMEMLAGVSRYLSVPTAALLVSTLVLRGSFGRIEHVLLVIGAIFATYLIAAVLARPDWGAAARGLVVVDVPGSRAGLLAIVATVGTTLAPWGLAFMQSYAADKRLSAEDLPLERVDVVGGAVLTGVIGAAVVIACAATIHASGGSIDDAADAAQALQPLVGGAATVLFGLGLVGAGLLAAAVVPLSTAYSVAEARGRPAELNDTFRQAPLFYVAYTASVSAAVALILVPGAPLVPILYLSQALNAVLLLVILPFLWALARDRELMGEHRLGRAGSLVAAVFMALIALCVVMLGVLTIA